jgi:hypothetical protein
LALCERYDEEHAQVVSNLVHPLSREQCLSRLSRLDVGRVSVSVGAMPVIVPVEYVVDRGSVIFHAPLDRALAAACDGAVIAFEVDDFRTADAHGSRWSVHVVGVGAMITDLVQLRAMNLHSLDLSHLEPNQTVRLRTHRLTGHKLDALPAARAG